MEGWGGGGHGCYEMGEGHDAEDVGGGDVAVDCPPKN